MEVQMFEAKLRKLKDHDIISIEYIVKKKSHNRHISQQNVDFRIFPLINFLLYYNGS